MKASLLYGLLLMLCFQQGKAQAYFEYDQSLQEIYDDIIDLKLDSAEAAIKSLKSQQPDNLAILHIENYIDFFTIFITEEKSQFEILEKNKEKRIDFIKKHGDKNDPYYNFVLAEINLQWALARSKFDELFHAGREIINAYKLLRENDARHPDFIYNKKSLSIIHALIETITLPGIIKGFFGIEGTIKQGVAEIEEVLQFAETNNFIFTQEAEAIYAYILFYQDNQKDKAWSFLQESSLDPSESPLACFLVAKIAQRSGHNDQAIEMLSNKPEGGVYSTFHYLDFMLGASKLRRLDPDADIYIQRYLQHFEGRHFIKEAHQKLAWHALIIDENIPNYKKFMLQVTQEGYDLVDDDKQAQKEAKRKDIPHPDLLKARLLYDGGYFQKAYNLLIRKAHLFYFDKTHLLEYNYRIGRVSQALKNYPDAIVYFSTTVNQGAVLNSYFACNAALQMGIIYESQGDFDKARKNYHLCLDQSPNDYKNSLHQKAKTGLNRIKEK